ncbi:hypothetical protein BCV72DRAFT_337453 [Rhizopus microsporus var. microsporus]|uniref:Uncharacterized protein n=2 Tax=Rhizopus microsporus TaxID=58291 RepID=A0A2G4T7G7_RHIZD|nr:uncharacterized protein RHIMIDRAFT_266514 [Rhizopus microsporus ATCC 52813]ORE04195.1 hypothetical protein BCV72DRAFT_337453 [Rhizopus microsporus var. microsporus]PHZ16626.1 hypothetical protein RHIMIDRAFT_266514 [Rhizopus microsporus ATCC 52813]
MVAMDINKKTTNQCIKFTIQNLLDEGDELVILGLCRHDMLIGKREMAERIARLIERINDGNKINVAIELLFADYDNALARMNEFYRPIAIIVESKSKTSMSTDHYSGTGTLKCELQAIQVPIIIIKATIVVMETKDMKQKILKTICLSEN